MLTYPVSVAKYPRPDPTDLEVPNYFVPQQSYVDSDAFTGAKPQGPIYIYSVEGSTLTLVAAPYLYNNGVLRII